VHTFSCKCSEPNGLNYRPQIVHHLLIAKSEHLVPVLLQMFRTGSIVVHLLIVDIAINFYDEPHFGANEVNNVTFEGDLAAKTKTIKLSATEGVPELSLCRSHACSKLAGEGIKLFGGAAIAMLAT
jgi:hypothetical protein